MSRLENLSRAGPARGQTGLQAPLGRHNQSEQPGIQCQAGRAGCIGSRGAVQ